MFLEWVNRRAYQEGYPLQLFGIMWLLALAFSLILQPILNKIQAGGNLLEKPVILLLKVALLILIAWLWMGILQDQMDCFLGVPLCD